MKREPLFVGIAGGTGSGKTTLALRLAAEFRHRVVVIPYDAYYKDLSHLPFEERARINYDHPLSFDQDLFLQHMAELRAGRAIERPTYDYRLHVRRQETVRVEPADVVIVEGILIFESERIRSLFDIKVFVDTDADVRVLRRLLRDIRDRGRTVENVVSQYLTTVKPMHDEFVEPSKRYADLIVPEGGFNPVALDVLIAKLRSILDERDSR
ncbi:MAG: uridine kinase [Firmicutes bacterium]|nr:uridine kinase [Bacillota bacterium]